ncbi:MAG: ribonucleoside triphosphate reductase [Lachnospiraceae bacterium]|nr:ribonucleoside triphosphate reductase [Lachnospiraceae bacterium]
MFVVSKRNGEIVDFNIQKIKDAIEKAFIACKRETHPSIIDDLAQRTAAAFGAKIKNGVITVEEIQDSVEEVLIKYDYGDVAKAYIIYRKKHEDIRKTKETLLNYKSVVDNYLNVNDWRVKENSTVTYSVGGLILSNSGAITANYWLSEVYDEDIANAHRNAEIHIHDLSMLTGYCAGWSLKQLIKEGLGGIPGKITSSPAKHLSTLCNQMVNFLGIMQNEWAGAQAFSSFDTYLAPFVKIDNLTYDEVKQCIQSFIYGVNTPSRWGTQSPFTNVTLDWTVPNDLAELPALVGGKEQSFKYKDCKKEMDMVNKAFIEVMIEGDANGRGFQYPIPTYSITKDFDWSETENNKLLFEMSAKYGTPYFSNYVNSDMEPSDVRSMCCRLRLDLRELRKKSGGFFGSGESTGSVGVVTINMPRLAYLASTEEEFYKRLDRLMDISARSLKIKRNTIERFMENGLYPYTKRYLGTFNNHFSTIGLVGMNEACLNAKWLQKDLRDDEAVKFSINVLNHMRERLKDYQEKYGDLYNLEATPAESTAYRFAKHDKEKFPNIITANMNGTPYYTNSSHLPVGATDDIFNALDVQDELQTLYTSGTVFHTFLGEKLPDWRAAANLVRTIANNYRLPYYTLSPTYSVCKNHGYIAGEVYTCPHCGEKTEVNSRITGYYRPVQNWNDGKAQEFKDRKEYSAKLAATRIEQMGETLFKAETPDTVVEKMNFEREHNLNQTEHTQVSQTQNIAPTTPVAATNPVAYESAATPTINTIPTAPIAPTTHESTNAPITNNTPTINAAPATPIAPAPTPVATNNNIPNLNDVFRNNNKTLDNINMDNFYKDEVKAPIIESPIMEEEEKEVIANDFSFNKNITENSIESVKLFVTKTCPNCKKAEELLDMAGIKYSIIDANENPDECRKFEILQAPTLIVNDSVKYVNLSNVIKFVEDTTINA